MKKKTIGWIAGIAILFALIGYAVGSMAGSNTKPTEEPAEETEVVEEDVPDDEVEEETNEINQNLADWIPRQDNVTYSYEGFENEYASFKWIPQFNQENYYQIAVDNGGTVIAEIYEYRNDEIVRTFRRPETYFRDNFTAIGAIDEYKENEVILKKPIAVGTNWSTDEAKYEITAIDKEIIVPAGEYKAIEVTIKYNDYISKRYYAENVGLVYEWSKTDGLEIESKLERVETNTVEVISVTVYQGDDQALGLDRIETEIRLQTNDPARMALQELFSGENKEFENLYLFPKGTEINYLFLNDENIVEIDLSSEYIKNMNTGSSGESLYLKGLGNTLSQHYGVEKVLLTVDGENYEGGHILLRDGEYLIYDESMVN